MYIELNFVEVGVNASQVQTNKSPFGERNAMSPQGSRRWASKSAQRLEKIISINDDVAPSTVEQAALWLNPEEKIGQIAFCLQGPWGNREV